MEYDPLKVEELKALVRARLVGLKTDRYADPIKVFIKPEPHKSSKLREGRLRLISAVSLVDTMVDRVLFSWLMEAAVTTVGKTPSMIGWVPIRGSWRALRAAYPGPNLCVDKSAWDWTVQGWLIEALEKVICELALEAPPWWIQSVRARFCLLFEDPTYQFLDGSTAKQPGKGIMKSGCYLTILANTLGQVLIHCIAATRVGVDPLVSAPKALGDDTLQRARDFPDVPEYVRQLESLGCQAKVSIREDVEFAGFEIDDRRCVPAYYKKHLFKTEYSQVLPEYLANMQYLYSLDDVLWPVFRGLAVLKCPSEVVPRAAARAFMA